MDTPLDFQVTFDAVAPHDLADWWAETLGWVVEPTDELGSPHGRAGRGWCSDTADDPPDPMQTTIGRWGGTETLSVPERVYRGLIFLHEYSCCSISYRPRTSHGYRNVTSWNGQCDGWRPHQEAEPRYRSGRPVRLRPGTRTPTRSTPPAIEPSTGEFESTIALRRQHRSSRHIWKNMKAARGYLRTGIRRPAGKQLSVPAGALLGPSPASAPCRINGASWLTS